MPSDTIKIQFAIHGATSISDGVYPIKGHGTLSGLAPSVASTCEFAEIVV